MAGVLSQRDLSHVHCSRAKGASALRHSLAWPSLSAEEKLEGYCLPCVALPMLDVVIA